MTADGRARLAAQSLPVKAREHVMVALAMIDVVDREMASLEKELRAYARRQPECKALMRHYGIGDLIAVTTLAELGDCRRFSSSRQAVRDAGMDITVHQSDQRRAPGHLSRQGPSALRWALYEAEAAPTVCTSNRQPTGWAATAHAFRSRAACSSAATTRSVISARKPSNPPDKPTVCALNALVHIDAPRPAPVGSPPPRPRGRPQKNERPQRCAVPRHPIPHHVADPAAIRIEDRDKSGRTRTRHHSRSRTRAATRFTAGSAISR